MATIREPSTLSCREPLRAKQRHSRFKTRSWSCGVGRLLPQRSHPGEESSRRLARFLIRRAFQLPRLARGRPSRDSSAAARISGWAELLRFLLETRPTLRLSGAQLAIRLEHA